jgi:hypothetical protein
LRPRRRRVAAVAAACALIAAAGRPAAAWAHGLVGRADLPVPGWLFGWAAAVVLVVSFVALATLWPTPRLQQPHERRLIALPGWVVGLCGALGVALFGLVVYAGFAGTKEATLNLAPNVVYVHFWVGVVVASVLLGDIFAAFNPWRAVGRAAGWAIHRVARVGSVPRRPYPPSWGRWPAALGILAFAWLELVYVHKADPPTLATLALVYFVVQLLAMAVFGVEQWCRRGDAFGVYFNLYSRLAPLVRREGALWGRVPLSGAPPYPVGPGTVALLVVAIGSTTFDGFSNGPVWASINRHLQSIFADLGAGLNGRVELAGTVGLLGCVLVVGGFYRLGIRGMRTAGEGHGASELARRFVHTLIPIAFAYALAHYFSLLLFQGQSARYLISDPLGNGSDLFGTASAHIDYGVISANAIWYVQVGALVCGHVAGLVLAHDRAVAMYRSASAAARSQYWMLVVMVGFTSLGLWLLSAVNGTG